MLFALELSDIISALTIFYSLMSVSLAAPLVFGLLTRRASNAGAIMASLCGIALTLFCTFYQGRETVNLWVGVLDTQTHLVDFGIAKLNAATCNILLALQTPVISGRKCAELLKSCAPISCLAKILQTKNGISREKDEMV